MRKPKLIVSISDTGTPNPAAPPSVEDEYCAMDRPVGSMFLLYSSSERETPSTVQYGSVYTSESVRLTELVLSDSASALPEPKMFCCDTEALNTTPSELE